MRHRQSHHFLNDLDGILRALRKAYAYNAIPSLRVAFVAYIVTVLASSFTVFFFIAVLAYARPRISRDGLMKELYGIDMELTQHSKTVDKIPSPDIVISMGCDVGCPFIGRAFDDVWGLPEATWQDDKALMEVIKQIEAKLKEL